MNLETCTLLLTRPQAASERFAALLQEQTGAFGRTVISPLLEIVPVPAALKDTATTGFLFTSEHGARAAAALSPPAGRVAYCVGGRTARVATELGYRAHSADGAADDLFHLVKTERPAGSLIHARGRHTRGNLVARLNEVGITARDIVVYEQEARQLTAEARASLASPGAVLAPVFSPRSAALLAEALPAAGAQVTIVAISPDAAKPFHELARVRVVRSTTANAQGMCDAVLRHLST